MLGIEGERLIGVESLHLNELLCADNFAALRAQEYLVNLWVAGFVGEGDICILHGTSSAIRGGRVAGIVASYRRADRAFRMRGDGHGLHVRGNESGSRSGGSRRGRGREFDGRRCRIVGIDDKMLERVIGPPSSKITSRDSTKCPDGRWTRQ